MGEKPREFTAESYAAFLKGGRLMGVRCRDCGTLSAEARPMCHICHGREMEWHELAGKGVLTTFTCISIVPARMAARGYGRDRPYCSGVVSLKEGIRVPARIAGVDASDPAGIHAGTEVVLCPEEIDHDSPGLVFRPA